MKADLGETNMFQTQPERGRPRSLSDKIWRDRHGNVVLAHVPNVWLIGWAVLAFISLLSPSTPTEKFFWRLSMVSLVIWALLEIFKGVNYFRRALGVAVLLMAVLGTFVMGL
jgi:hypothetical protein